MGNTQNNEQGTAVDCFQNEQSYRILFEYAADIVIRFNCDGSIIIASERAREIIASTSCSDYASDKKSEDALLDSSGLLPGQDGIWTNGVRMVCTTGSTFESTCTIDFEGTSRTFSLRFIPELNNDHTLNSVMAVGWDITAQLEAETRYRSLFTQMLDAFALHKIICNENGEPVDYRFIAVNPAFERHTGLLSEQIVGKLATDVLPNLENSWIRRYARTALHGESLEFEDYSVELDRYYSVSAFQTAPGEFATVFTDITEYHLTRERLEESSRL